MKKSWIILIIVQGLLAGIGLDLAKLNPEELGTWKFLGLVSCIFLVLALNRVITKVEL